MYQAFMGKVRPGKEPEYIEAHRSVWPDLIRAMHSAGVQREMVFMSANYLFVYLEADDIDSTNAKLAADPVNQRWDAFMEPLLEPSTSNSHELFYPMIEVFRLETPAPCSEKEKP
jgi:L-rhamnose mutarotase